MIYKSVISKGNKQMVKVRDYAIAHGLSIGAIHKKINNNKLESFIDPVTGWKFIIIKN